MTLPKKIHFRRGGFKYGHPNGKFDAVCGRSVDKAQLEVAPNSLEELRTKYLDVYCNPCHEAQWIHIRDWMS